jgi:hypothetical protein
MAAQCTPHVVSLHDSTPPVLGHTPRSVVAATSAAPMRDEASSPVALTRHLVITVIEGCLITRDENIQEPLGAYYSTHRREGVDDVQGQFHPTAYRDSLIDTRLS